MNPATPSNSPNPGADAPPPPLRVLLVEDNPGDAELIRVFLRQGGGPEAQVECVDRLALALNRLDQAEFDATVLDLGLPDSQGMATLQSVINAHAQTPVVVLTGQTDRAVGQAAIRAGAQDYFVKGQVDEAAFNRALRYAVERKQVEATLRQSRLAALNLMEDAVVAQQRTEATARALRESEQRYRLLADNTVDVIWLMSPQMVFTYVNPAIKTLTGFTPEEWVGSSLGDHCDARNLQLCGEIIRRTQEHLPANPGLTFEVEMLRKDGRPIAVEITGKVLLDEQGRVQALQGITRDITERKRTEAAVVESETRLRLALDGARMGTFDWDIPGDHITWTRRHEELWGFRPGEFGGTYKAFAERVHPEDLPDVQAEVDRCRVAGEPFAREFRVVWPDGSIHWISAAGEFVFEGQAQPVRMRGVVFEITQRKQAEVALRESEERFRRAVEEAPVPILLHDEDDRLLQLSRGWTRYSGYTLEDLPTLADWTEKAYGSRTGTEKDYIDKLFEINETTSNGEWEVTAKNGAKRIWDFQTTPLGRISAGKRVVLSLAVDVTDHKRAEARLVELNAELEQRVRDRTAELEAANQELESFSYSVSHDLRAPLRHIDGFVELLAKRAAAGLDARGRHYLDTIADSAKQMGRLIDDLLAFSRMGRAELRQTAVDVDRLVRQILKELAPDTQGRNLAWQLHPLPTLPADPAMIYQVLLNLLSNAIKYTRPRDPARIEVGCGPAAPHEVTIFVRDNGVGFDPRYTHKLFTVFQRLHRSDEFEGAGIGLANVRRIIHRHGGRTWAEGDVDQGATFYFTLPISAETPPGLAGPKQPPA